MTPRGVEGDAMLIGDKNGLSLSNETTSGINGGDWFALGAAAVDAGADIFNNERNINLQKHTNEKNESLMRESWLRDDTAVQRRVADLKAAGLSPTLAAGSAASNSGPVSLSAPRSNLKGGYGAQTLAALSAVKALKQQDLQNELLKKQIINYGKPDWFVALHEIFGTDRFEQLIHGLGDWLYNRFFPGESGSSGSGGGLPGSSEDPNTDSAMVTSRKRSKFEHVPVAYEYRPGPVPTRVIKDAFDSGLLGYDGHFVVYDDSAKYVSWVKQLMSTYGLSRQAVESQIKNYVAFRWHKSYYDYDRKGSTGAVGFGAAGGPGYVW